MGYIGIYREPHILEQSYSSLHQAHESTMKTVIQLALLSPKATKSTFQVLRSSHWSLAHSLLSRVGKNKPSLPICKLMTLLPMLATRGSECRNSVLSSLGTRKCQF